MTKSNWKRRRQVGHLTLKDYNYFIFCEGEKTEPFYFEGFKRIIENNPIYKDMISIKIEPCKTNTIQVVEFAEKYIKDNKIKNAKVYCVYDKDSFPAKHFNAAIDKINSLNENESDIKYHAIWSNQCIEIWFILHFAYYNSDNHRTQYIEFLNTKFKSLGLSKYEKNMPDIFEILYKHGQPKLASRYAKKLLDENVNTSPATIAPATKVYELVEEFAEYLPEQIKSKFI